MYTAQMFDPPLPPHLSFHLSITDSALVLVLRTLESTALHHAPTAFASDISLTGFSLYEIGYSARGRRPMMRPVAFFNGGEKKFVSRRKSG